MYRNFYDAWPGWVHQKLRLRPCLVSPYFDFFYDFNEMINLKCSWSNFCLSIYCLFNKENMDSKYFVYYLYNLSKFLGNQMTVAQCLTCYYEYFLGYLLGSIQRFLPAEAWELLVSPNHTNENKTIHIWRFTD